MNRRHLALLVLTPAFAACSGPDDDDSESDDSADDTAVYDTGYASVSTAGTFDATATAASAQIGLRYTSVQSGDTVCWFGGTLVSGAPVACPECDWSFDFTGVAGSTSLGWDGAAAADCAAAIGTEDGMLDGSWDYAWGFASDFDVYGDGTLMAEGALLYLYNGGWRPFAIDGGERDELVSVTSDAAGSVVVFDVAALDEAGAPVQVVYYR